MTTTTRLTENQVELLLEVQTGLAVAEELGANSDRCADLFSDLLTDLGTDFGTYCEQADKLL